MVRGESDPVSFACDAGGRGRSIAVLAVSLSLALTGCGSGGGSGGSTPSAASAVVIDVIPGTDGRTHLEFDLVETAGVAQMVVVEFSDDRGSTFHPASLVGESSHELSVGSGGGTFEVDWSHADDLDPAVQSDLLLRVTPREEESGITGLASTSDVFGVGANTSPTVESISTPTGTQGGVIAFDYVVSDPEEDHVQILLEYSLDDGLSWNPGTVTDEGDGSVAVATTDTGAARTIHWSATTDAPDTISVLTRVRLTPSDTQLGALSQTGTFPVQLTRPEVTNVTIGRIPDHMNGSGTYTGPDGAEVPFTLRVPSHGYELRIETAGATASAPIDPSSLEVLCDTDLAGAPAGTDLAPLFAGDTGEQSWLVPSSHEAPPGHMTFSARIRDLLGNVSTWRTLTVDAQVANQGQLPFDWNDTWWLDFGMDQFSIAGSGGNSVTVDVIGGSNGIPDHLEDLLILGLRTNDPLPEAAIVDTNFIVQELVEEEILGRLRELYGGDFDGLTPGFAPTLEFTSTPGGHTSSLRIGGDDSTPGFALGRAAFDPRNVSTNHNRASHLGVFSTNLIEFYVNSFYFRLRFQALMPGIGTPVGEDPYDAMVLSPGFDRFSGTNPYSANLRYDAIWRGIEAWGRAIAAVAAHEIGHSIGLCANGAPPAGLFGGVSSASFAGPYTSPYHFDTTGNNLMASALSFSSSMVAGPSGYRFNELNEAYLRQWMILGF